MNFTSSIGGEFLSARGRYYQPKTYFNLGVRTETGYNQFSNYNGRWIWSNVVSYKRKLQNHQVDFLLGHEAIDQGVGYSINALGQGALLDNVNFISLSTISARTVEGSRFNGVRFVSFFGRINYDFADRYLISAILRRDGSSRFGSDQRYGLFPSFTVAWRPTSEKFLRNVWFLDDLRIHSGIGVMGNSNNVDPDNQFTLFSTSLNASSYDIRGTNSDAATGFYRTRLGNAQAKWERVRTFNIGLDISLLGGSIDFRIDYWKKDTKDLLFRVPRSVQTGFFADAPFVNVGEISNVGTDFMLRWRGHRGKVDFALQLNGGFLNNKIESLTPRINTLPDRSKTYGSVAPVLNMVGQPLSSFFGYEVQGLFGDQAEVDAAAAQLDAAPGRLRFKDQNGDGEISAADRIPLGSPIPDFTGGLSIVINFREFELLVASTASVGNDIYHLARSSTDFSSGNLAISTKIRDSWTPQNRNSTIPIFENTSNFSTNAVASSYFIEDGSYFRLQNITLSYSLPSSLLHRYGLDQIRIFGALNNIFTVTKYTGFDPSVGGPFDTNFGIDLGNVPITKSMVFGMSVKI